MKSITIRFYEELNDFLPKEKRKVRFTHEFFGRESVKDLIEAIGVPHTEVDLILVNGNSVDFNYILQDKDEVSVYPVFESFDIKEVQHLRPKPLREPKFVLDIHLGKLARYMRMLGFDTFYRNDLKDEEIVHISLTEIRTILTRDVGLLKRGNVTHGYFVRNTEIEKQLKEVVKRFQLENEIKEFSRCIECNTLLKPIDKEKIIDQLPPKVRKHYNEFYICPNCSKIYWKGSHVEDMLRVINKLKRT
jgi:uncharacterized protein with PIN domain